MSSADPHAEPTPDPHVAVPVLYAGPPPEHPSATLVLLHGPSRRRATPRRTLAAALLLAPAALAGCTGVGPAALSGGRPAYNAVINETEDEQILSMIVRQRYDETFGMLAVSSVTAGLRVGATAGANFGIGPRSGYDGNLVPLSAGVAYEENPTISYVPLRGEQFIERMLAPISGEQALLLSRMSTDQVEVLRLLVRRANGSVNPLYAGGGAETGAFGRFIDAYARLRDRGRLDIVRSSADEFQLLIHDYAQDDCAVISELLDSVSVQRPLEGGGPITVPLRFFVGSRQPDAIDLETPSALEVIEAAASGVQVPAEHVSGGRARAAGDVASDSFVTIQSSRERPALAAVAVAHHGWWFFVDARDARSKQGFMVLRTLIGLRLDDAAGQSAPVLTVPVGR